MINGTGSLSLRKQDLENQKIPAIGFVKTYFAHKASAGQTGINLSALSTPSEMTANGFVNPTASQLAAAQLLFFQNNLKLVSSFRGVLQLDLSYTVATSTQINFVGFTALDGEIFTGTIDYNAMTGIKVVDATAQPATGVLAAAGTTFSLGQSFQTNKYSTAQVGACLVYLDGVLQFRNTGNSSSTLDGNYYEVDNGSGSFSTITFNVADPVNARNVIVVPNGLLSERPDGSMMAVIETVQGEMNNMAAYVAALAGQSTTTVLGAAPSNVDLTSFGNRVVGLEAAGSPGNPRLVTSSASGAVLKAGQLLATATNDTPAAGYVGETIESTGGTVGLSTGVFSNGTSIVLTPGDWLVSGAIEFSPNGAVTGNTQNQIAISAFSANTTTDHNRGLNQYYLLGVTAGQNDTKNICNYTVRVSSGSVTYTNASGTSYTFPSAGTATMYVKGLAGFSAGAYNIAASSITARRMR